MIATGEGVTNPSDNYKFMIILSPAKSYYSGEVKVLIEHFSRAANGGIAKAAGNYAAQFYPTSLANAGFQQVIWTDDATHTKWKRQVR
jgi:branched-chain amino acid aminotransferase